MKTKLTSILIMVSLIISISLVCASQPIQSVENPAGKPVYIPEKAIEVSKGVYSLGYSLDSIGRPVQGFLFELKKDEIPTTKQVKPQTSCGNGICEPGENKKNCAVDCAVSEPTTNGCYAFMFNGARWKSTEDYVVSSDVNLELTEASLDTWDKEVAFNIFGQGSVGLVDGADDKTPDNKNEVLFADLGATNTIAYTITWVTVKGPPGRQTYGELIEWDMVFNSYFPWSYSGEAGMMDFQNIATHELGHALGLDHPLDTCTEQTMYAYASLGETKKRDLEQGDLTGVNLLYA